MLAPARDAGLVSFIEEAAMRNPWMSKNPFMSAWLSSANHVASVMRGHANAAARREIAAAQAEMSRQIIDFWSSGAGLLDSPRRRR